MILEGFVIAIIGVAAGLAVGFAVSRLAGRFLAELQVPAPLPLIASAVVILAAAVIASTLPAARAARVDTVQALRAE